MKFNHNLKLKKPTGNKKTLLIIFGVVIGAIIIGLISIKQWYSYNLRPVANEYSEQITAVESGSSVASIAEQLSAEGLIRSEWAFNWYVTKDDPQGALQAGTYKLSPSYSSQEIAQIMFDGRVETDLIRISPGRRLDQVADSLVEYGFSQTEVDEAINANYSHSLFKDKPAGTSLEGYIFPETYQVTNASTASSVIEHSFDVFYDQLTSEITAGISKQGLNLYEAITLASIVQKEVSDPDTQRQVAQVFLKRLNEGIVLGSDVTFLYAAEIAGQQPTVDFDSPYNTRVISGLPPGPISNFNISALEAVANPAEGDYLFFVAGDDGNTYFAYTLAEHEANAAKYCIKLCEL